MMPWVLFLAQSAAPAARTARGLRGYTPFLDPLPLDRYWLVLLVPMVLAIAVVYKAIKLDDLAQLPRQTLSLAAQIVAFMLLAAAGLWLISEIV
jgi:hypothetical protein